MIESSRSLSFSFMKAIPIHQAKIPKIFNNCLKTSLNSESFLTLGCHFAICWSQFHSTTTFFFTLVVAFCSLCYKMPMESFIIFTFMDWQLWHWRTPFTSGKAPKFALNDDEIIYLFQVCSQQPFHNIRLTTFSNLATPFWAIFDSHIVIPPNLRN
jgi:hypothetical protein